QKGFTDDDLFDVIEKLTYPEIGQFLRTYVGGDQPLPLEKIFAEVGIRYKAEMETSDSLFSMGKVTMTGDPATHSIVISDTSGMNEVGRTLGYHVGDRLKAFNGKEVSFQKLQPVMNALFQNSKPGDSLVVTVVRKDGNGQDTAVDLKGKMKKYPVMKYNALNY